MSEKTIKEIIARASDNGKFRKQLLSNPTKALEGYELTDDERDLLSDLDEEKFDDFAGSLGDRTTKGAWSHG